MSESQREPKSKANSSRQSELGVKGLGEVEGEKKREKSERREGA
jgi:hypothetical protein